MAFPVLLIITTDQEARPPVIAVRTRKVQTSVGTHVVGTLSDGPSRPLGGPRSDVDWSPELSSRDNHREAAEALGRVLGMGNPHADDWTHLGYGTFEWTVIDYASDPDANASLWV
jgi:hypothetical protein